jgi:opacity protein-like surface antigen
MKNYLLLFLFMVAGSTRAQTSTPWLEKGEIQIGAALGANFGKANDFSARAAPYIQYFIKDRWAVRLEGQYEMYGIRRQWYLREDFKRPQYLGAGLSTQYHFMKKERFSLYGQAGYSYGQYRANLYLVDNPASNPIGSIRTNYGRFSLGAGAQYRLTDRWMINALIERQFSMELVGTTSVQLGVGFRIK